MGVFELSSMPSPMMSWIDFIFLILIPIGFAIITVMFPIFYYKMLPLPSRELYRAKRRGNSAVVQASSESGYTRLDKTQIIGQGIYRLDKHNYYFVTPPKASGGNEFVASKRSYLTGINRPFYQAYFGKAIVVTPQELASICWPNLEKYEEVLPEKAKGIFSRFKGSSKIDNPADNLPDGAKAILETKGEINLYFGLPMDGSKISEVIPKKYGSQVQAIALKHEAIGIEMAKEMGLGGMMKWILIGLFIIVGILIIALALQGKK